MHGSQLRKRPKLWALIEASTERHSKDITPIEENDEIVFEDSETNKLKPSTSTKREKILIINVDENENEIGEMPDSTESDNHKAATCEQTNNFKIQLIGEESNSNLDFRQFINEFAADCQTPVLEEPELSVISGSSAENTPVHNKHC